MAAGTWIDIPVPHEVLCLEVCWKVLGKHTQNQHLDGWDETIAEPLNAPAVLFLHELAGCTRSTSQNTNKGTCT
jgi:hypothetical protein